MSDGYAGHLAAEEAMRGQPDLQTLINEGKPIYVLNQTGKLPGREASDHILVIKDGNNNPHEVMIPATKFPFLLSGALPPSLLRDSPELYTAFRKKILTLCWPEEAQRMLEDPMAQIVSDEAQRRLQPRNAAEARRLEEERRARSEMPQLGDHRPPGANPGISAADSDMVNDHVTAQPPPLKVADSRMQENVADEAAPEGVNLKVVQLMLDLANTPENWNEIMARLAGTDDEEFEVDDLGYIIEKAADHKKIVQWAQSMLEKRSSSDDRPQQRRRRKHR